MGVAFWSLAFGFGLFISSVMLLVLYQGPSWF